MLQNAAVRRPRSCRASSVARPVDAGTTAKFDLLLYARRARRTGCRRRAAVQHRPLRRRDGRRAWPATSGRCSPALAADPDRPLSRLPLLTTAERAAARGAGTRRRGDSPGGALPARAGRGAGGAHARTPWRCVFAGASADLPRARRAAPTGWPAALRALGVGPDVPRRHLRGALARDGGRRCSASSRPAAPTCRSIPPTPRTGWPSCWRTPRAPVVAAAQRRRLLDAAARRTAARWSASTRAGRSRRLDRRSAAAAAGPRATSPTSSTPRARPAGPRGR